MSPVLYYVLAPSIGRGCPQFIVEPQEGTFHTYRDERNQPDVKILEFKKEMSILAARYR